MSQAIQLHAIKRLLPPLLWIGVFGLLCLLYASLSSTAEESSYSKDYYPLLARAFSTGHCQLPIETPPGFAALPNPYDPKANVQYRFGQGLADLSYYKGAFYLYFGPAPAIAVFTPWRLLTGGDLSQRQATILFCALGVTALMLLWDALTREEKAFQVLRWLGFLSLALASGPLLLLRHLEIYEVSIAAGFCFLSLAVVSRTLAHRAGWLGWESGALLGLFTGLCLGSRASLLPAVAMIILWLLLEPGCKLSNSRQRLLRPETIAFGLVLFVCGAALASYNYARFGSLLESGLKYQLANSEMSSGRLFSLAAIPDNLRAYLWQAPDLAPAYPFLYYPDFTSLPLLPGCLSPENEGVTGLLFLFPGILAAGFGVLPRLRQQSPLKAPVIAGHELQSPSSGDDPARQEAITPFRWFFILGAANASLLLCFFWKAPRYEVDFLPYLVFAALGGMRWLWLITRENTNNTTAQASGARLLPRLTLVLALFLLLSTTTAYLESAGWAWYNSEERAREVLIPARLTNALTEWLAPDSLRPRGPWSGNKTLPRLAPNEESPLLTWRQQATTKGFFLVGCDQNHYRLRYRAGNRLLAESEPFCGQTGELHTFDLQAGAMLPPSTASLYNSLSPEDARALRMLLLAKYDGREILRTRLPRPPTFVRTLEFHP